MGFECKVRRWPFGIRRNIYRDAELTAEIHFLRVDSIRFGACSSFE